MRWTALALLFAAVALGCGGRDTSDRARLWTLFDLVRVAQEDGRVAAGGSFATGIAASYFVTKALDDTGAENGKYVLTASSGFVDGQPMTYLTTELWSHVDEVWVQPLYLASAADGSDDDPVLLEPWVFGIGPGSLFYSPFWQVYRFQVPSGVDVTTLLDARAVLEAANRTGGLRRAERRITSLAPADVFPTPEWEGANIYHDDTAAWDGVGRRRYLDVGTGRFDVDGEGVVKEVPIFVFTKGGPGGEPTGWPNVGGTRPLFSAPPALINARDGGMAAVAGTPSINLTPNFGGLWRMHTVDLPDSAAVTSDQRVVLNGACLTGSIPCVVLDSQTAVESLGAERIHRTELLASCPVLQIGALTLPDPPVAPPLPMPTSSSR